MTEKMTNDSKRAFSRLLACGTVAAFAPALFGFVCAILVERKHRFSSGLDILYMYIFSDYKLSRRGLLTGYVCTLVSVVYVLAQYSSLV